MSEVDKELEEKLGSVGRRLATLPSDVKELHLLLDEVETLLLKVDQSPLPSMYNILRPAMNSLVSKELTRHLNMDVKVAVASCISEITRITAPEAPYDDDLMRDVFGLIVESFKGLDEISSPSYHRRVLILETVAKVRSCLVMLDLQCDNLIIEMFRHFLATIREDHSDNVFTLMETIMTLVLEESEDISTELIKDLLACVKNDNKDVLPVTRTLVEHVIRNCSEKLKPYLLDAIISTGASSSDYSKNVDFICPENFKAHQNNKSQITTGECVDEDIKSSETTISQELSQRPEEMESEVGCLEVVHSPTKKSVNSPISNGNICTTNEKYLEGNKVEAEVPRKTGKLEYNTSDIHLAEKRVSDSFDDGNKTRTSIPKDDSVVPQVVNETVTCKDIEVSNQVNNLGDSNESTLKKEVEVLIDTEIKSSRPLSPRENDTISEFKESQTQNDMHGKGNMTIDKDDGEKTNKVHTNDELSKTKEKSLSSADTPLNKEGVVMGDAGVKSPRLSRRKKNKNIDDNHTKKEEGGLANKVHKHVDDLSNSKENPSSINIHLVKEVEVIRDTEGKSLRLSRRKKPKAIDESKNLQTSRMPLKGSISSGMDLEGDRANKVDNLVDDSIDIKEKHSSLTVISSKNEDMVLIDTEGKSSRTSQRKKDRSSNVSKKSKTQVGMLQKEVLNSEKDAESKQAGKVDMHVENLNDLKEQLLGSEDISLKNRREVLSDTEAKSLRLPRRKKDKTNEGSKKSQIQKGSTTSEKDDENHLGGKLDKHVDGSSDSKEKSLLSADISLKKAGVPSSDTEAKSPRLSRRIKDKITHESDKNPKQGRPQKGVITNENDAKIGRTNKVDNHVKNMSGSKEKPLESIDSPLGKDAEILSDTEAKSLKISGRGKGENTDKSKKSQPQGKRPRKGSIISEKDSEGEKNNKETTPTHSPKEKNIKSSSKKRGQDSKEISILPPLGVDELDEKLIGTNIRVWWPEDKMFYDGVVDSYNKAQKKHKISYVDGDVEVLLLQNERWEIVDKVNLSNEDGDSEILKSSKIPSRKKAKNDPDSTMKQDNDDTTPLAKLKAKCSTKSSKSCKVIEGTPKTTNDSQSEGKKTVSKVDTPKIESKSKQSTTKTGGSKVKGVAVKFSSKSKNDVVPVMENNPAEVPEGGVVKAKDSGEITAVVGDTDNKSKESAIKNSRSKGKGVAVKSSSKSKNDAVPVMESNPAEDPEGGVAEVKDNVGNTDTKSNETENVKKRKNLVKKLDEAEEKKSDGSKRRRRKQ